MADIDTDRLRAIQRVAADRIHPYCRTARDLLTEQVPAMAAEIDRLGAENQRLRLEALTAESQALEVEQQLRSEVARLNAANGHLQQELAMRPER